MHRFSTKNGILVSPHNDDETLFAAYTLIREKPLVIIVTDSYLQFDRGTGITAAQRRAETVKAMQVLGCRVEFLGYDDRNTPLDLLKTTFLELSNVKKVYSPALQGGNALHDHISRLSRDVWPHTIQYATYAFKESFTPVGEEIVPTDEEMRLKNKALDCYMSQLMYPPTSHHFDAVRNKSEYIIRP